MEGSILWSIRALIGMVARQYQLGLNFVMPECAREIDSDLSTHIHNKTSSVDSDTIDPKCVFRCGLP